MVNCTGPLFVLDTTLCEFVNFFTFCLLINFDFIVFDPKFNYLNQEPVFSGRKNRGSR